MQVRWKDTSLIEYLLSFSQPFSGAKIAQVYLRLLG